MYTLRFVKSNPFVAVYEGEDLAAKAIADKVAADKVIADKAAADALAAAGGTVDSVANQAELNAVLKREKDKFRTEREKLIKELEGIQNNAKTTNETKAALETQLEELRRANLSVEERARLEKAKLEKDYTGKLAEKDAEANQWRNRHNELQTGYSIASAASAHAVVPTGIAFLESYLKPRSKLVEVMSTDGKGTGKFEAKVTLTVPDKEGKPVDVEYSVGDAVKQMKDMPETYGFLFASSAAAGLGAGTGTPGKAPNVAKMSPEAYMEARKKNPASIGLK